MNTDKVIIYIWLIFSFRYFRKGKNSLRGETIQMLIQFMMTTGTYIIIILSKTWLKKSSKNYCFPFPLLLFHRKSFFPPSSPGGEFIFQAKIKSQISNWIRMHRSHCVVSQCSSSFAKFLLLVLANTWIAWGRMRLKMLIVTKLWYFTRWLRIRSSCYREGSRGFLHRSLTWVEYFLEDNAGGRYRDWLAGPPTTEGQVMTV